MAGSLIDRCSVVFYYEAPAVLPGEDSVEVFCHRWPFGYQVVNGVFFMIFGLSGALSPGEFSRIAFERRRWLSLNEAEAVVDLIHSERRAAGAQLSSEAVAE